MFFGGGLLALMVLALWVYCILDVIATDDSAVRNLPKMLWLFVVIFIPTVGSVAWLILGRPQGTKFGPRDTATRSEHRGDTPDRPQRSLRAVPPDDDPGFLAQLDERTKRLREWEDHRKRRDENGRRRDNGDPE